MIGQILVGLGGKGTEGACYTESATRLAIELAQRHDAALTGVTVADLAQLERVGPVPIGAGAAAAEMREKRVAETRDRVDAAIRHFEEACREAGRPYRVEHEERGEAFDFLTSLARYHDLTVIGLRGLFEFGVSGETHYDPAATLLRLVTAGVRPIIATGPECRDIGKVLIAYSGSHQSAKTMRRFVQMRLWPDATVRLIAFGDDTERRQRHLTHAAAYCQSHGIEAQQEHRSGDAKTGLLDAAHEWGADLIVMGNSHHTLIARHVLGDTVLHTLQHSELPIFFAQ